MIRQNNSSKAIILDTDIGYDPDDLFALLFLYKLAPDNIELIITANEIGHKRTRFLKQTLGSMKVDHINIAEGSDLGLDKFTVDELLEQTGQLKHVDFIAEMKAIIDSHEDVIYIGIGGFTNLSKFIEHYPDDTKKMKIFVMGGAINYERHAEWIEFNVKIDTKSAQKVLESGCDISYIMAQTTHNPIYEVTADHRLYKKLAESDLPEHQLLLKHLDLWFAKTGHGTSMHDPLTVAAAFGLDYVDFNKSKASFENKRFKLDENGCLIKWSDPESKAKEFMDFLEKILFGQI
jgi:inosine-uridine nucleoside N-ribohydrolase